MTPRLGYRLFFDWKSVEYPKGTKVVLDGMVQKGRIFWDRNTKILRVNPAETPNNINALRGKVLINRER